MHTPSPQAPFWATNRVGLIQTAVLIIFCGISQVNPWCEERFVSSDKLLGGEVVFHRFFSRPDQLLLDETHASLLEANKSIKEFKPKHCIYKFIAREDERVIIEFSSFLLRGDEPECAHEYLEIYPNFRLDENISQIETAEQPSGRFCSTVMPRRLVSLNNVIVLVVHSDLDASYFGSKMFVVRYQFEQSKTLEPTHVPGSFCTYVFESSQKREGEFQSITYPGVYPKGLRCSYKFVGDPGQRVRLEFLDLDLYSGGTHCPLDVVKIFDGPEESDPLISTICGSHRSVTIFSSRENLLVTFNTLAREGEAQNRGFSAYFEFSDRFVDPSFIRDPNAKHIRGTECDQRIVSRKGSFGTITSPVTSHHINATCRYIFEGLQTAFDNEKVQLRFTAFNLENSSRESVTQSSLTTPSTQTFTQAAITQSSNFPLLTNLLLANQSLNSQVQDSTSTSASNTSAEICPDNYVRLYTSEMKPDQKQDPNDYDYMFCSNELPQNIESDTSALLVEYFSGSVGGFFVADYQFTVDFRVTGTQISSGCEYVYRSDILKSGTFNSPRNPSWYMNNLNCSYYFMTRRDEFVLLTFVNFKMANTTNVKANSLLGYSDEVCHGEDRVEIHEMNLDYSDQRILNFTEIGAYCGTTTPGPILRYRPVRVTFRTNREQLGYGFFALFTFYPITALKTNEFVTNCGGDRYTRGKTRPGTISSPATYQPDIYEKRNHICSWDIHARPNERILLNFTRFELEGNPSVKGCAGASVRVSLSRFKPARDICGSIGPKDTANLEYVSEGDWLGVVFISTKRASGSTGFEAQWSAVNKTDR